MRRLLLCIALFSFLLPAAQSQQTIGFRLPDDEDYVVLPFEMVNNLMVVPVTINGRVTLDFIVDTGASTSILTDKFFSYLAGLNYDRQIQISGPGLMDSVTAYVSNGVTLSLPSKISGDLLSLLVLEEDYIQLEQNVGRDIYGIIGYDFFSRYPVKINYDKMEMTVYQMEYYRNKKLKRYSYLPLDVEKTKPYIFAQILHAGKRDSVRLMIDTGASHSLLIDLDESENLDRPERTIRTNLGYGLGGEIPGEVGRFDYFIMGEDHCLEEILVSIPDPGRYSKAIKRGSRDGTIGANALKRFEVIFSYPTGDFYFRKSKSYRREFEYDMSGLRVAYLQNPDRIVVRRIIEGSPADEAGLEVGMKIKRINNKSLRNDNITETYSLLRRRPGKKIRVFVYVEEEGKQKIRKFTFKLRRLI
jgi:hypothetical protein